VALPLFVCKPNLEKRGGARTLLLDRSPRAVLAVCQTRISIEVHALTSLVQEGRQETLSRPSSCQHVDEAGSDHGIYVLLPVFGTNHYSDHLPKPEFGTNPVGPITSLPLFLTHPAHMPGPGLGIWAGTHSFSH
jgi:hypothetical protein